jgi:formylglycine-generating enzyme required for sulfatase activity
MWPWGSEPPVRLKHAHLSFRGENHLGSAIEVGCFPSGTSPEGLVDLIGNVYELLDQGSPDRLAGGAWTTDWRAGKPLSEFGLFRKIGKGAGNVGIRPVLEV